MLGIMRAFPGYSLAGARAESVELLRLLDIYGRGHREEDTSGEGGE